MLKHEPENVSPQGKQNVYFTCHPDDFDKYFWKVYNDIRKFSNCIVWYNTEEKYKTDEITLLEKMNLFVVPITTKLLTQTCRTMRIDIPYAQNNTKPIPILPLMQEHGLDELFYKNLKDLQYLDPNSKDNTAISYEEKLKKYLNSVLIGDKLATKIRAAFDAYIFMSYRKKDRKYANELMRLIHENDFCRDIAIWYDEYLVPGEDFNHAIKKALKKSELFTMVVTPNLINESNYVKTYEYPNATKRKKKILPVEMVQTDHDELTKQYPTIPNSVDGKNNIALSNALKDSLVKIAHTENDTDPQHNFFIGLAYLNGIDVEINNERALNLITSAAESKTNKVPEAIEKLVSMYRVGHGVKRDYNKVIEWQKKLVDYWNNKYRKSRKIEDYKKLFFSFHYLGEQLCNIQNFVEAENVYNKMINLCKKKTNNKTDFFITYYNYGNLYFQKGELDIASKNYQKIIELYADERKNKSVKNMWSLAIAYGRLSEINLNQGYLENAQKYNKKCMFYNELLLKNKQEVRYNLTLSYKRQGNILCTIGDSFEARKFYDKSCKLIEQLIEEKNNNIDYFRLLANIYAMIGDLYSTQDSSINIQEFYKKSIDINLHINKQTETIGSQNDLAASYSRYGDLLFSQGKINLAEQYFQKSFSIYKQLVIKTKTVNYKINLSKCYEKIGNIFLMQGIFNEAEKCYQKCNDLCKAFIDKNNEAKRELSVSYALLGVLYKKKGLLEKARIFYNKSLIFFNQLAENSLSIEAHNDLIKLYTNLMDLYCSCDDIEEVEKIYHNIIEYSKKVLGKSIVWETKYLMSSCYIKIGDLRFDCGWGDFQETEIMYRKSLKLREQLNQEKSSIKIKNGLIIIYSRLAELYKAQNEYEKALFFYNKSLVICEDITKTDDNYEVQIKKSFLYMRIGSLCFEKKQSKQANIFYQKSIEICEKVSKEIESVDVKRCLSITYSKLGNLRASNHEIKEAEKLFLKSIYLFEIITKDTEDMDSLRELSTIYRKLGEVYLILENPIEAEKFCKKNIAICKQFVNKSRNYSNIYELIISYDRFADLRELQGDKKNAKKMYYKGVDLCEQLLEKKQIIEIYELIGTFFIKIAFLNKPYNLFLLEKALQIYGLLAKEYPQKKIYIKTINMILHELNLKYEIL